MPEVVATPEIIKTSDTGISKKLLTLESKIYRNKQEEVESLIEIKEGKLYRERGFNNFYDYADRILGRPQAVIARDITVYQLRKQIHPVTLGADHQQVFNPAPKHLLTINRFTKDPEKQQKLLESAVSQYGEDLTSEKLEKLAQKEFPEVTKRVRKSKKTDVEKTTENAGHRDEPPVSNAGAARNLAGGDEFPTEPPASPEKAGTTLNGNAAETPIDAGEREKSSENAGRTDISNAGDEPKGKISGGTTFNPAEFEPAPDGEPSLDESANPKHLIEPARAKKQGRALLRELTALLNKMEAMVKSPGGEWLASKWDNIQRHILQAHLEFNDGLFESNCPACRNSLSRECHRCAGKGYLDKAHYRLISEMEKKWLEKFPVKTK